MPSLLRLFHTLRHLRPRQLYYQLFYRISGRLTANGARPQVPGKDQERAKIPPPLTDYRPRLPLRHQPPATFTFLNKTVAYGTPTGIDWNDARHGKLWTYNLNYFEYLRRPSSAAEAGHGPDSPAERGRGNQEALIHSWIAGEATHRDGWEPYPLSLRLVNWLQYYREAQRPVPAGVHVSIRRQYRALGRKIEYHLDGNHLLENLLALCITARYLGEEKHLRRYRKELATVSREQYLPTGAHYEGSVMYQLVLLFRWLDFYSWFPADQVVQNLLQKQVDWLVYITTPAGRYPHFNDSTDGIAPETSTVFAYADSLGIVPARRMSQPTSHHHLSSDHYSLWLDLAPIGPDHIPGHAHADSLTFVLDHGDRPCIVDVGISTYEKNVRRAYERSTAAHNTVEVNGQNSSDVWGGFRVGKRARTQVQTKLVKQQGSGTLTATHNGYPYLHRRTFHLADSTLVITDDIGPQTGTARFHFHESITPELTVAGLEAGDLTINWSTGTAELLDYQRAAGFNRLVPAKVLTVTFTKELVTTIRSKAS